MSGCLKSQIKIYHSTIKVKVRAKKLNLKKEHYSNKERKVGKYYKSTLDIIILYHISLTSVFYTFVIITQLKLLKKSNEKCEWIIHKSKLSIRWNVQ